MQLLSALEMGLIEGWQRGLPLASRPYAAMADALAVSEEAVIGALARLCDTGVVSRVGATLRPNTAGASLLAAMSVPTERMDEVVGIVNAEPGVNHNYEREHAFNLWFVVTGRDRSALDVSLARIREASALEVLELPLERSYHIDLGFSLSSPAPRTLAADDAQRTRARPDTHDLCLLEALEHGLPLEPQPYAEVAARCGVTEAEVMTRIGRLISGGVITRFGLIVRHRALGITANAMAVWSIPNDEVDAIGAKLAREPAVNLCYRRPRRMPDWPYNLFCMVHGRERDAVRAEIAAMARRAGIDHQPSAVLFSSRCFRQRGPSLRAA